jgi:hypothetical protein
MSNLYREPSKDASYQVLIHIGQAVSEEKIFLESIYGRFSVKIANFVPIR